MKTFYRIENGQAQVGSGTLVPDGFVEYSIYEEPQELTDALSKEQEAQDLQNKLNEAKAYLANTDYIVTKIAEAQALGEDTTLLLSKYAVELQQRKEAREFVGANS